MRIQRIALLGLAAVFFLGCSNSATTDSTNPQAVESPIAASTPAAETTPDAPAVTGSFQAKISDTQDLSFDPKSSWVDVRPDLRSGQFAIGNYDFNMEFRKANMMEQVTGDGHVRVQFSVQGEKGKNFDNPIQPGEYTGERLQWVKVFYGKSGGQAVDTLEKPVGRVTITSTTATEITGTIDVTAEVGKAIKGDFTAKRTKE